MKHGTSGLGAELANPPCACRRCAIPSVCCAHANRRSWQIQNDLETFRPFGNIFCRTRSSTARYVAAPTAPSPYAVLQAKLRAPVLHHMEELLQDAEVSVRDKALAVFVESGVACSKVSWTSSAPQTDCVTSQSGSR